MSPSLVARSTDLSRLRAEGYEVAVRDGHLLLLHVPYLTPTGSVAYGTLVSVLTLNGDVTTTPNDHVVHFMGERPSTVHGSEIPNLINAANQTELAPSITINFTFSNKPDAGFPNYYDKMTHYVNLLAGHAQAKDPNTTAKTFFVPNEPEDDSVFLYSDSASTRAGIAAITAKLTLAKIAIVGLGGTGSYILDFVAKTPVKEIHLFDGDRFLQHNAFRAPGAASIEDLQALNYKVDYYVARYSPMRRGIVPHPYYITDATLGELEGMDFVFAAAEGGTTKRLIVEKLEANGIPFVDVGMGVYHAGDSLAGVLAVTTSTPALPTQGRDAKRIDFADTHEADDYDLNIQIAELNALNAALAVIRWKKHFGFYGDLEGEHYSAYTIDGNHLLNEDTP
jgi:hypothetical protein